MMSKKAKPVIERDPTACVHRWRIDMPDGPSSGGCCVKCGELRIFRNSDGGFSTWAELKSVVFD